MADDTVGEESFTPLPLNVDAAVASLGQDEEWKLSVLEGLAEEFDRSLVRERRGGSNQMFSYVAGHHYVKRLNDVVGEWDFDVLSLDAVTVGGKELMIARVSLTIPGLGRRQHVGVQTLDPRQGEDSMVKGAVTDGLKKAASLFGVGLYLSFPEDTNIHHPHPPAVEGRQPNQPAPSSYGARQDQAASVEVKNKLTAASRAKGWDQVQLDSIVQGKFRKQNYNMLSNGEAVWLTNAITEGKIAPNPRGDQRGPN